MLADLHQGILMICTLLLLHRCVFAGAVSLSLSLSLSPSPSPSPSLSLFPLLSLYMSLLLSLLV